MSVPLIYRCSASCLLSESIRLEGCHHILPIAELPLILLYHCTNKPSLVWSEIQMTRGTVPCNSAQRWNKRFTRRFLAVSISSPLALRERHVIRAVDRFNDYDHDDNHLICFATLLSSRSQPEVDHSLLLLILNHQSTSISFLTAASMSYPNHPPQHPYYAVPEGQQSPSASPGRAAFQVRSAPLVYS